MTNLGNVLISDRKLYLIADEIPIYFDTLGVFTTNASFQFATFDNTNHFITSSGNFIGSIYRDNGRSRISQNVRQKDQNSYSVRIGASGYFCVYLDEVLLIHKQINLPAYDGLRASTRPTRLDTISVPCSYGKIDNKLNIELALTSQVNKFPVIISSKIDLNIKDWVEIDSRKYQIESIEKPSGAIKIIYLGNI